MPFDGVRYLSTARVLREARDLIADPGDWVQGVYITYGNRRCAAGAVRDAARTAFHFEDSAYRALLAVAKARGFLNVEVMNDRSAHAEVLSAFDEAIAAADAAHGTVLPVAKAEG